MIARGAGGRRQGVLTDWNDARGFGFIEPAAGGPRVFVHVSAFPRGRRPTSGCHVTYVEGRDERDRRRASQVRYIGNGLGNRASRGRGVLPSLAVATLFLAVVLGLVLVDELPLTLLAVHGVMSVVAFTLYGADKSAAVQGRWRTPESTLHIVDLLGGWPGGLVARHLFRHKTTKQPFLSVFWLTVAASCAGLAWLVSQPPLSLT